MITFYYPTMFALSVLLTGIYALIWKKHELQKTASQIIDRIGGESCFLGGGCRQQHVAQI